MDLAVMDINLRGKLVFPAARILRERGIPFIFSTGYGDAGLPLEFSKIPVLAKPFAAADLQSNIAVVLSS